MSVVCEVAILWKKQRTYSIVVWRAFGSSRAVSVSSFNVRVSFSFPISMFNVRWMTESKASEARCSCCSMKAYALDTSSFTVERFVPDHNMALQYWSRQRHAVWTSPTDMAAFSPWTRSSFVARSGSTNDWTSAMRHRTSPSDSLALSWFNSDFASTIKRRPVDYIIRAQSQSDTQGKATWAIRCQPTCGDVS